MATQDRESGWAQQRRLERYELADLRRSVPIDSLGRVLGESAQKRSERHRCLCRSIDPESATQEPQFGINIARKQPDEHVRLTGDSDVTVFGLAGPTCDRPCLTIDFEGPYSRSAESSIGRPESSPVIVSPGRFESIHRDEASGTRKATFSISFGSDSHRSDRRTTGPTDHRIGGTSQTSL